MKKLIFLLLIFFCSCSAPRYAYYGEVKSLYVVETIFGDKYYFVEIKEKTGRKRKVQVYYSDWIKLKAGQEIYLY